MLKHLLSLAAVAAISLSANAANRNMLDSFGTNGWGYSYDSDTKTATYEGQWQGSGWWVGNQDYSDFSSIVVEFAEPTAIKTQLVIAYCDEDGTELEGITSVSVAEEGSTKVETDLNDEYSSHIYQVYLQSYEAGSVVIKDVYLVEKVAEGDFTYKELAVSGKNLLLSEFVNYDDSYEIDVILTISNASSNVAAGWGVGAIHPISDYTTTLYSFSAKEVSAEGAENKYKFTIGEFKAYAKDDSGEYRIDEYNQSGLTFNLYNGATLSKVQVVVPNQTAVSSIAVEEENAPVEYFNLQGVRVANPQNGLFIKRQGSKATKVLVK